MGGGAESKSPLNSAKSLSQSGLTLGYIENKRVQADLARLIDESNKDSKAQIAKYLSLSENLILTDYLRFLRIGKNTNGKIVILAEVKIYDLSEIPHLANAMQSAHKSTKYKSTLANLESKQKELLDFFALFFSAQPKPIISALEFANALAQRTKLVKNYLQDLETNQQINTLYNTFKKALYKDLDFTTFCDSFAQTLTYALFLAKLNDTQGDKITLYNAESFIPQSFPLIRAMSGFLRKLDTVISLKWLISEILAIINHIDIASLTLELNKISHKNLFGNYLHKDPYLHFYETFLSQYDPRLRELRGVYYTPFAVVKFIIDSIDSTLKHDFGESKGLGSALENDNITLLDFATGTGTFLLEAFRKALDSTPPNSLHYKPKNLLSRFNGFEFLIAPYTIAHLKISQTLKEENGLELNENERFNIYLTNTLQSIDINNADEQQTLSDEFELALESKKAQEIKNNNIMIITGNPPYNALSTNKYDIEAYKFCGLDEHTKPIPNNDRKHRLNDDYIKFIRFAQNKIDEQEMGIIAIITNNSFLDGVTMNGMRWNLLNSFDKIYILNLHGDSNKKEVNPNGGLEQNVFDIMQGVCISIFVKLDSHNKPKARTKNEVGIKWATYTNNPKCQVFYYDIYGSRKEKYDFLSKYNLDSIEWENLNPQDKHYIFIPQDKKALKSYEKAWSVKDIFIMQGLGICTYRDTFCYADSKETLMQRITTFADENKGIEELRKEFNLPKDSRDWTIKNARAEILDTKNNENFYNKVHFKPFDFKYTYFTGKSKKFLGCPAGAIQEQMLRENVGLICDRGCKLQKIDNIFIADMLIDLHLAGGGSYLFPIYLYETQSSKKALKKIGGLFEKIESNPFENTNRIENFTPEFRAFIDSKYQWSEADFRANPTLFVNSKICDEKSGLCSHERENKTKASIDEASGKLPDLSRKAEFTLAPEAILGYIYAVLYHKDYREKYIDFLKIDFPKIPFVESKETFLALSALGRDLIDLHLMRVDLSGESVGEALFSDLSNKNEKIEKIAYNAESKGLFVNSSLYFDNVSAEVWEYKIGGYAVLDKYLKSHKGESIDYDHFECIIKTLHKSLEIQSKIAQISLASNNTFSYPL